MSRPRPSLNIRLRSIAFFVLYNLMGMAHSLLCLMLAPFQSFEQRYRFVNLWTRATMWLLRVLNGIHIRIEGLERLPRDKAVVIMVNHQSQWETFYLQLLICPQATVLKRELLKIPFFGWGLALLRPIAIDRSQPKAAMKLILSEGRRRLDEGISVVIYPEGTRQPPRKIGRFGPGGSTLACRAGCPVVPMVHNAGDCWPNDSIWRYPGTIVLRVGHPISCDDGDALGAQVEQWIRSNAPWEDSAEDRKFIDPPAVSESPDAS